jgi:hypothetical protein
MKARKKMIRRSFVVVKRRREAIKGPAMAPVWSIAL